MKKLKKVLSLVLVLAMALSVFGVCASATNIEDYSDKSEITYTKAVGVLSGLGVLEGSEKDGVSSFKPLGNLNRAEAAKIATYLIGVQDKVVDSTTFTDVSDSWAKSYIAIAQSQGLINGRNATTYDPAGTLTGYEWEKIVLCALGYDAEIEGLVGATWQGATAVLAGKVGLLEGMNDDYDATKAITREQAALIAYNALYAKTVLYPYTINKIAELQKTTLGELVFGLKNADTTYDIFGAPVKETVTSTKVKEVYAEYYEAVASYTDIAGGVKVAEIADDMADLAGKKTVTTEVYVDGVENTTDTVVGGRGVKVDVYKIGAKYRIVEINTYATKIAGFTAEKTNTNGTVTTPSYVKGLQNGAQLLAEGYNKNDIIVYNVGNTANTTGVDQNVAANVSVEPGVKGYATTVGFNGTLATAKAGTGYIYIDNATDKTFFDANAVYGAGVNQIVKKSAADINTGYYNYVYDNYGHIIYVENAKREKVSEVGHLYVIGTVSYYTKNQDVDLDNLYYPVLNPQAAAQALVINYTDDSYSIDVVDLAITQTVDGTFKYLNEYGEAAGSAISVGMNAGSFNKTFAEYYVNEDGEYILKTCANLDAELKTTANDKVINKSASGSVEATVNTKITYLSVEIDPYTATNLTKDNIVEVAKDLKVTVKTATGFKEFASMAAAAPGYLETGADGKATVGAIMTGVSNLANTTKTAVFTGIIEKTAAGDVYTFYTATGDKLELSTAAPVTADVLANGVTACTNNEGTFAVADENTVYNLTLNSKGQIVGYQKLDTDPVTTDNLLVTYVTYNAGSGYVEGTQTADNSTAKSYYFGADIKVYDQNTKTFKAATEIKGDVVKVYLNDKKQIIFAQTVKTYTAVGSYIQGYGVANYVYEFTPAEVPAAIQGIYNENNRVNADTPVKAAAITAAAVDQEGAPYTPVLGQDKFDITIAVTDNGQGTTYYTVVSAVLKAAE
jgi:hypothetical protein